MATANQSTRTYKVLHPVQADDRYEAGDQIELTEKQAAQLIKVGAIEDSVPKKAK